MNATDDGDYVFYSGSQNYQDFSRVALWKGQRYVKVSNTVHCDQIVSVSFVLRQQEMAVLVCVIWSLLIKRSLSPPCLADCALFVPHQFPGLVDL